MKPAPLELRKPASLQDALAQLAALGSDAQILAGGQSLLPLLRYRVLAPHVLLDINGIADLEGIHTGPHGVRVSALARHSELERMSSGDFPILSALLAAHARQIAFAPVRNRGTAVGSLVQADPKGDWPLVFFALDARVELTSLRRKRSLPVRHFIEGPLQVAREVDEIVTAIELPTAAATLDAWGRSKIMHRTGEYAMCSAVVLRRGSDWECWIGAAGDRPQPLASLAKSLSADPLRPRSELLRLALTDIRAAFPEVGAVAAHRHAVNAVDAVQRATAQEKV